MKNEDIPALIRELRQPMNLRQEQFAQKVDVTYSTVKHQENGKRVPLPFLENDSWRSSRSSTRARAGRGKSMARREDQI